MFRRGGGSRYGKSRISRGFPHTGRGQMRPRKRSSYVGPTSVAANAFRTGQAVTVALSSFTVQKTTYGVKSYIFLDALTSGDWSQVLGVAQSTYSSSGVVTNLNVPQKVACRNYRSTLVLKNVSTYQLRIRVSTLVCRRDLCFFGAQWADFEAFFDAGFLPPYANTPSGETPQASTNVSSSLYQNPLLLHYFKIIRQKSYTLMPYRSRSETLHLLKKKPGLYVNDVVNAQADYVARTGGWSSCLKIIEVVGEITNDGETYPDTTVSTSAGVLLLQQKASFQCAAAQSASMIFGVGDPAVNPGSGDTYTGQPWNYMFPTPGTSGSFGTSTVLGALSSGR